MSTFVERPFRCPACNHLEVHTVAAGINAARAPRLREQVLSGELHRFTCASCAVAYLADETFSYIDFDRKQWVFIYPVRDEIEWADIEREPREVFDRNLTGPYVAPVAVDLGRGIQIRAVFGVAALQEKLVSWEAGLDDALVEIIKLEMMRTIPELSLDIERRPRLHAVSAEELCFSVRARGTDGDATETIALPRLAYQDLEDTVTAYAAVLAELRAGPYVDVGRLLLPGRNGRIIAR